MFITVEATYEGGVLKLRQPLPLNEHATVQVIVQTDKSGTSGNQAVMTCHDAAQVEPSAQTEPPAEASSSKEPLDFEGEMLDIFLNLSPSPTATTVTARRGRLPLPDPPTIPPDENESV